MRAGIVGSLLALMAVAPSRAVLAQDWYISTEAGRIRAALDPTPAQTSVSLGLRYEDLTTGLRLTAGVPTRSGEALWAGVGGSKRLAVRAGSLTAGIDLLGHAFAVRERQQALPVAPGDVPALPNETPGGYALAGQAMPVVAYEGVRVQLRGRAGVSRYASRIAGQNRDRTVRVADLQATWMPSPTLAIGPVLQLAHPASDSAALFAGASIIAAGSSGSVMAMLGRWSAGVSATPQWNVGGRWRIHPNVSADVGARRTTFDPVYLQPPQTSWSVGLSVLLGRPRVIAPPVPASYSGGRALIRLPLSAARTAPSIAGDFNGWQPAPMQRSGDHWTYTAPMAPGVYHYAFVNADGEWFVPDGVAGRKDDGMGGHVAVLVVR